jgi:hypothetical protein
MRSAGRQRRPAAERERRREGRPNLAKREAPERGKPPERERAGENLAEREAPTTDDRIWRSGHRREEKCRRERAGEDLPEREAPDDGRRVTAEREAGDGRSVRREI